MTSDTTSLTRPEQTGEIRTAAALRPERRLIGRALSHWDSARGGAALPRIEDIAAGWGPIERDALYLVEVGSDEANDMVVYAGATLVEALGVNPVGRSAVEVLPSSTERGLSFCRAVVSMKKPIADVGRFCNARGEEVYYRSILLPLSDDQDTVRFVLGAFSFKLIH